MNDKYRFGNRLTVTNYEPLRKLAQNLSYKDFSETTSFKQGIHTRLRKFPKLEDYKNYIAENRKKYAVNPGKKITLRDVYEKLLEIEKRL